MPPERHRRRHSQLAPEFALQAARDVVRFSDIGQNPSRPLVIGHARFRQAETTGAAVEQARPEPRLRASRCAGSRPILQCRAAVRLRRSFRPRPLARIHVMSSKRLMDVPILRTIICKNRRFPPWSNELHFARSLATPTLWKRRSCQRSKSANSPTGGCSHRTSTGPKRF